MFRVKGSGLYRGYMQVVVGVLGLRSMFLGLPVWREGLKACRSQSCSTRTALIFLQRLLHNHGPLQVIVPLM